MYKLSSILLAIVLSSFTVFGDSFPNDTKDPKKTLRKSSSEFMHSGGAGFVSASDGLTPIQGWAFAYTPRLGVTTSKYSSFGVASPTLFALSFNSFSGMSGVIDLPVMFEYNFGYGSTEKAYRKDFGAYVGAGAGVTLISGGYGYGGTFANWNVGGGARFEFREQPLDLRVSFGQGFGDWSVVSKITFGVTTIINYR